MSRAPSTSRIALVIATLALVAQTAASPALCCGGVGTRDRNVQHISPAVAVHGLDLRLHATDAWACDDASCSEPTYELHLRGHGAIDVPVTRSGTASHGVAEIVVPHRYVLGDHLRYRLVLRRNVCDSGGCRTQVASTTSRTVPIQRDCIDLREHRPAPDHRAPATGGHPEPDKC